MINVSTDYFYLFVINLIPNPHTQVIFNGSIKNSFTLSFDTQTTDRQFIRTGAEYNLDIGASVKTNCLKYLIAAHQTAARSGFANETINYQFLIMLMLVKVL